MSSELVPALIAAGGGGVLLAGIVAHEHHEQAAMRRGRLSFTLTFPAGMTERSAIGALSSLAGLDHRMELVAEVAADENGVHHLLHVPAAVSRSVLDQLGSTLPGLRIDEVEPRSTGPVDVAVRIMARERTLLRDDELEAGGRALLGGLGSLREDERISLRWALRPGGRRQVRDATREASPQAHVEHRMQRSRVGQPAFGVRGLLLIRAPRPRARRLAEHALGVLRGRRGVGHGLMFRRGRVPTMKAMPRAARRGSALSVREALPLLGWPIGDGLYEGVAVGASRRLRVPREIARSGRQLFLGRDAYGERPVALETEAALHHVAVVGPSGSGKSVLLARGVLDQIEAGYGGIVIDPKADTVRAILDRVPRRHCNRVVVLDPADRKIGLDVLREGDPDLRADVVVGALSAIFARAWGIRTDYYLRLAVRSVADVPGATLADVGRILSDPGYRRQALRAVDDPFTLGAWQAFETLSGAEQINHVQAPLARVMGLLSRPAVRAVIAAPEPKLNLRRLLEERKLLLVPLSPGTIGEPAARLIASLVMYVVWSAVEARASMPADRRHPAFITVDELASVAQLPMSLEAMTERARGLGVGLTVATQTLSRLPESLRAALLGNVASLVTFRAAAAEAPRLAAELPGLESRDVMALGRFEVAARVGTGRGSSFTTVTGRTEPLPATTSQAEAIRQRSIESYGSSPERAGSRELPHETLGRSSRRTR